jgi:hypothetical protein
MGAGDDSSGLNVAAELASLRGSMDTGFARLEGRLDLIAQQGADVRKDVEALDVRVAALEARRVPWPLVAAVSGAVSAVGAVVGYMAQ